MPWATVTPIVKHAVRSLCYRPYPGHPRGCPNYGKLARCPPQAPLATEVIDLTKTVWAIWVTFDLEAHAARMVEKHPGWSDRQARNCLYWQPGQRKKLREELAAFDHSRARGPVPLKLLGCPEAAGIDVTATMQSAGITLEWPPIRLAYTVVLVGYRA